MNERLQRILDHPGRASMEDVAWLASLVVSLEDRLKQRANAIAKLHVELDQMQNVVDGWAEMNRQQQERIDSLTDEIKQLRGEDFIAHESGEKCLHDECNRFATVDAYPFCALCLVEYQLSYARGDIEMLREEIGRLKMKAASRGGGRTPR